MEQALDVTAVVDAVMAQPSKRRLRISPGLYINRKAGRHMSWTHVVSVAGRHREFGLGSFPDVSHADALAGQARDVAMLHEGRDPVAEREPVKPTFGEVAGDEIARRERDEWAGSRSAAEQARDWDRTFRLHCAPLMDTTVDKITKHNMVALIEAAPSAVMRERIRSRCSAVFKRAIGFDYRVDNPADRDVLKHIAAMPKPKHAGHSAAPYTSVGAILNALADMDGTAPLAARFQVLTAARSNEVTGMTWREVDTAKRVWRIPSERMKARMPHVVPLSDAAMAVLDVAAQRWGSDGVVFQGRHGALHYNVIRHAVQEAAERADVSATDGKRPTPHGMRSAFTDWAIEAGYDDADVFTCIAHARGSKSDRSYLRTAAVERRRPIMDEWADYITS